MPKSKYKSGGKTYKGYKSGGLTMKRVKGGKKSKGRKRKSAGY